MNLMVRFDDKRFGNTCMYKNEYMYVHGSQDHTEVWLMEANVKFVLDKEQCFCPLRCNSIAAIILYLSSTREKPLRWRWEHWDNAETVSPEQKTAPCLRCAWGLFISHIRTRSLASSNDICCKTAFPLPLSASPLSSAFSNSTYWVCSVVRLCVTPIERNGLLTDPT